ncbi:MAG: aminotransferase class III-fold pyridoxal phosphate-dependent enzyme [Bacillota bacterium]
MKRFRKYINPNLGELLEKINMDKEFIKGKGCYLYDEKNNKYLDCISNYGAVPFGHNHPQIWKSIDEFKSAQRPSLVKPSALHNAGILAEKLINLTPDNLNYVTFTNSGAESVEAAIKLSRSATGKTGILSTYNSFHGKTMGALSATGNQEYQESFGVPVNNFDHIEYGNLSSLKRKLTNNPDKYAAFILEPIQGEGGIITPPENYLKKARSICNKYNVLFILDEIQTGLGRTGDLFAFQKEGVSPDILLLAKALGGGIFPLGACISSKDVYNEKFADKHSSTFAGNALGCKIGARVLDILTSDDNKLIKEVKEKGKFLKNKLTNLKEKYPEILKSIRGRGFMLGIEFPESKNVFPDSLLGIMAEQALLTPVISSYLLNKEKMRVAPTLNGNNVIRIEPPLIMDKDQCREAVNRLDNMLKVLKQNSTARFISYLININLDNRTYKYNNTTSSNIVVKPRKDENRFAFLIHPLDLKNYQEFDKTLQVFKDKELAQLTSRWNNLVEPFVVAETKIKSKTGDKAYGEFITIPRTTRELLNMPKKDSISLVKEGLKLAQKRGAEIVGLGAYTAVVTMAGLYIRNEGVPITTGNSYTVVAAVEAVKKALNQLNLNSEDTTAAIIGATGSIGNGSAKLISQSVSRLILIGNPDNKNSSIKRLYRIAGEIYQYIAQKLESGHNFKPNSLGHKLSKERSLPPANSSLKHFVEFARKADTNKFIIVTTSIDKMLPRADVTICATNTIKTLITPDNLKESAVVCDISRPKNVSKKIEKKRPDVLVIDGGVIEVPGRPSMGWDFGFEKGLVYACMAETMMLTLEKQFKNFSIGSSGVNLDNILYTRQLAQKHGFKLATLRSFDRPLSKEKWNKINSARAKNEISI